MYVPRAMYSFSTSFWTVPESLARGMPRWLFVKTAEEVKAYKAEAKRGEYLTEKRKKVFEDEKKRLMDASGIAVDWGLVEEYNQKTKENGGKPAEGAEGKA